MSLRLIKNPCPLTGEEIDPECVCTECGKEFSPAGFNAGRKLCLECSDKIEPPVCPDCNEPVAEHWLKCPICGHFLSGAAASVCPACREPVKLFFRECPACLAALRPVLLLQIENAISSGSFDDAEQLLSASEAEGLPARLAGQLRGELTTAREQAAERKRRQQEEAARQSGENPLTCPITGMEFVEVSGGVFDMGDVWGDGNDSEKPVHRVTLDGFLMGKFPVTQAQWQKVMGDNPSHFKGDDRPVESVSWKEVQAFIRKLNQQSGCNYRLPTEAEWEYAARSGGKKEKWAGCNHVARLSEFAWYDDSRIGEGTSPVGDGRRPNGLGLYDMSGNVWEWCQDVYAAYRKGPETNPLGGEEGSYRVIRGGSWGCNAWYVRASCRDGRDPGGRGGDLGFRLLAPVQR